jgi:hypothetical protein
VRSLTSNEQQGPTPSNRNGQAMAFQPFEPAHMTCALFRRLRPLQCGEAYYSVFATNNTTCDEPFLAYKRDTKAFNFNELCFLHACWAPASLHADHSAPANHRLFRHAGQPGRPKPCPRSRTRKKRGRLFRAALSISTRSNQNVYFAPRRKYRPMMFGPAQAGLKPNSA